MRQTAAVFVDAYRELNAKRLFWISLSLSAVVVLAFAALGINERGLTFLRWEIPLPITTAIVPADVFYKWVFVNFGIKFWLGWVATILALVSTAGMIPDFVSSGSIELTLCKPIGRLRLFLTKYLAGLLFVALQVGVFSLACFLVIGIRGRAWEPGLFWAVPLTVCTFSYLYAICAVIGLMSRSTVASLLLTLLVWFGLFGIHTTETALMSAGIRKQMRVERMEVRVQAARNRVERDASRLADAGGAPSPAAEGASDEEPTPVREARARLAEDQKKLVDEEAKLQSEQGDLRKIDLWHRFTFVPKTLLPKTRETADLLRRKLISAAALDKIESGDEDAPDPFPDRDIRINGAELQRRTDSELRKRSVSWVLGTSLGFEGLVLALGAWIFCRRDF